MKFSHSLQFNAVPEWIDKYVAYDHLKKLIFQAEKERVDVANHPQDPEVMSSTASVGESAFLRELDIQLAKVSDFYCEKESELYASIDRIDVALKVYGSHDHAHTFPGANHSHHLNALEKLDSTMAQSYTVEDEKVSTPKRRMSLESRMSDGEHESNLEELVDIRNHLISLYVSLSELESYIELNKSAFQKILKKHDKVLETTLRENYLKKMVLDARPFTAETYQNLRSQIECVERMYAKAFCSGNIHAATRQMRSHLRDQIVYDRNTVWKDMINNERRMLEAHAKDPQPVKSYKLPFINKRITNSAIREICFFLLAVIVFAVLLNVNIFQSRSENYCFALLIFAAIMWATEAIPLYATSLMIPFLVVLLGIVRNTDGSQMAAKAASKAVFGAMFSGTVLMLLGGFAIAAALSKYGIAKAFATHVLSRAGTRPRWVLLSIMFIAAFLCMWISNVATPVLCFSLINPILRTLPDNSPVGPCLILGIALASCIGGMTSPISSPQNIVTIQFMNPSPGWGIWFGVALPIAILSLFVCWGALLLVYRPDRASPHLNKVKATSDPITIPQVFIMLVTIMTIALWCAESSIEDHIGDTGIIAAIPLFVFFGTGILNKEDLNAFLWSVVVLAQGGMALGFAVTSSGLLQDIALRIKDGIQDLAPIAILAIFAFLLLVFSTFVSHTVAALIIVPIVQQVGNQLPVPHANLLVMGAGLACSAGMGLPVSGYPNMSAVMLEGPTGKPYLTTKDFLVTGIPISIFCTILIFTLGYGIMTGVGY
ncbi:SPX domain-containing protein [Spinellus fusiger]|nr:SPX domain-containing protein [Spinellus fusiger]